ncbi:MAG: HAD family hydrolase [Candidatus Omnitrophota bacterium]
MRFKGILLDLDGTLYDYNRAHAPAHEAIIRLWAEKTGLPAVTISDAIAEARISVHDRLRGTAACHGRLLYFQGACERLGVSSFPLALDCYRLYWDVFIKNIQLYDGVAAFFDAVARIPVVIVTDLTADVQHRKIIDLGLAPRITGMVTSEEAGCEKPAPFIFHLALRKLGVAAAEACMIGDDPKKDIEGAAAVGMTSFLASGDFNPIIRALNHG